ncbi:MAG: hypothetical protein ACTSRG_07480 [Candidatus Helarchaeota archaeon]
MPEKKVVGFRIDEKTLSELEQIAKYQDISISQLIKKSLNDWLNIVHNIKKYNLIIIGKSFLRDMLEEIEDENLEEIVPNTVNDLLNLTRIQIGSPKSVAKRDYIKKLLDFLTKALSKDGLSWLDYCTYKIDIKKIIEIKGVHDISRKFSLVVISVISYIMEKLCDYLLIEKRIYASSSTFEIAFKPKYG